MFNYLWEVAAGFFVYLKSFLAEAKTPKKKLPYNQSDVQRDPLPERSEEGRTDEVIEREESHSKEEEHETVHKSEGEGSDGHSMHDDHEDGPIPLIPSSTTPPRRLDHPTRQRPKVSRTRQSLTPQGKVSDPKDESVVDGRDKTAPPKTEEEEHVVPKQEDSPPSPLSDPVPIRRPAGGVALPGFGGMKFDPSAVKLKKTTPTSSPAKEEAEPVDFRSMLKKTPTKT